MISFAKKEVSGESSDAGYLNSVESYQEKVEEMKDFVDDIISSSPP